MKPFEDPITIFAKITFGNNNFSYQAGAERAPPVRMAVSAQL